MPFRSLFPHRRPSNRSPVFDPVLPPDDPAAGTRNNWFEHKEKRPTPTSSPLPPRRSPRTIRFNIPEVQVSFEEQDPHSVYFSRERSPSPLPAAEIEWSPNTRPMMASSSRSMDTPASPQSRPSLQTVSLESDDILCSSAASSLTSMQRSGSEKPNRRSSAAMMRRQSTIQGTMLYPAPTLTTNCSKKKAAQAMAGRRNSTTLIPLTLPQIHLIRTLWRQIYITKGPTVIGSSLFHRLCFKSPEIKDQIRAAPLPPQFNNHDEFIKAHCKAVADLVDQVVESLGNLDTMTDELVRVGRVHAKMSKGGVTSKLWNLVAETFIDCTLEWGDRRCRSETVRKAWALIIAFMVEKIKLGHHEQRKLMLSARASMSQLEGLPIHNLRIA